MNRRKAKKAIREYLVNRSKWEKEITFSNFGNKNIITTKWGYVWDNSLSVDFFKVSKKGIVKRINTDEVMIEYISDKYKKYPNSSKFKRVQSIKDQIQFEKDFPRRVMTMAEMTQDEADSSIEYEYYTISQIMDKFQEDSDALLSAMLIR